MCRPNWISFAVVDADHAYQTGISVSDKYYESLIYRERGRRREFHRSLMVDKYWIDTNN